MIDKGSVRHTGLRRLVEKGYLKVVPQNLAERIKNRLTMLDAMVEITDLPQSYRAHPLKGRRKGTCSILINGPWRMTFKFRQETVYDLDLEQYH